MENERPNSPIIAFSTIFVLIFVSQFTVARVHKLVHVIKSPMCDFDSPVHTISSVICNENKILNYSTNWFKNDYKYIFNNSKNRPIKLKNREIKEKRDIIIVTAFNTMHGAIPFMKSLEQAEYYSNVAILADSEAIINTSKETIAFIEDHGGVIIQIGGIKAISSKDILRYVVAYDFMKKTASFYDRALICTFNVVFQSNPFLFPTNDEIIYFSGEKMKLRDSYSFRNTLTNSLGKIPPLWYDSDVINSEQVIGDTSHLLVFLYRYVSKLNIKDGVVPEQKMGEKEIFNVLVNSGDLDAHHVKYVICNNETFAHLTGKTNFDSSAGLFNIKYGDNKKIAMICNYHKDEKLLRNVIEQFPLLDNKFTNYVSGMNNTVAETLSKYYINIKKNGRQNKEEIKIHIEIEKDAEKQSLSSNEGKTEINNLSVTKGENKKESSSEQIKEENKSSQSS